MASTIEWKRNVPFTTNGAPPLKFIAYNPEGSVYFRVSVFHQNIAQSESVSLSAPNSQGTQLNLISVMESMPAVAHLSPFKNLELKSIFLVHKKLGDFNPRISCYQLRGGGSSDDMEFVPLDSSMAVNRTTTESGDMHVTITLTVSGSSSRDEGLYQCDFAKSGSSIMVSTLVLLETSTTHLPPNYDYIFMRVSLVLGDGYAKQGIANAITCKRISSIPGLPT